MALSVVGANVIVAGNVWDDFVDLPDTQYLIHHWWIFVVIFTGFGVYAAVQTARGKW